MAKHCAKCSCQSAAELITGRKGDAKLERQLATYCICVSSLGDGKACSKEASVSNTRSGKGRMPLPEQPKLCSSEQCMCTERPRLATPGARRLGVEEGTAGGS